jgi:hypothetical protein
LGRTKENVPGKEAEKPQVKEQEPKVEALAEPKQENLSASEEVKAEDKGGADNEPVKNTGIKKALNLPEVKFDKRLTPDEQLIRGKESVDSGKINPHDVIKRVIAGEGNEGYTVEEAEAMNYYGHQLEQARKDINNKIADIDEQIAKDPENSELIGDKILAIAERKRIADLKYEAQLSNRTNSNHWGKTGLTMKTEITEDYTPEVINREFEDIYGEGEVPRDVQKKLDESTETINKLSAENERLYKEKAEWQAKKAVENATKVRRGNRSISDIKTERKEILGDIAKKLKDKNSQFNSNPIPVEILPDVAKLIANYVEELGARGKILFDDVVDKIHGDLKEHFPDATRKDVIDAMSGHGYEKDIKQRSQTQKEIAKLKKQAELISKLEDLKNGTFKKKLGIIRDIPKEIKDLHEQIRELMPKAEKRKLSQQEKVERAIKSRTKAKKELEDKIANKKFDSKEKETIANAELDVLNGEIKDLHKTFNALKEDSKTPLEKEKERVARELKTNETKLKNKSYIPKEPVKHPSFPRDNEIQKNLTKIASAKHEIKKQRAIALNSQKATMQRMLDWIVRWRRRFALSGLGVVEKLGASAAIGNYAFTPIEEAIGGGWSKVFRSISEDAPIEGGTNLHAIGSFYKEAFKLFKIKDGQLKAGQRIKDIKDILKTGSTDLSKKYGEKFWQHYKGLDALMDMHTIIKSFPHASEFVLANKKMTKWAEDNGLNVNDPYIKEGIALAAFKKANYSIFLNDNALAKKFNVEVNEWKKKGTTGQLGAFVAEMMLPVNKVPSNIVSRVGVYATGLPRGLEKAGAFKALGKSYKGVDAMRSELSKAVEKLNTDEKEEIMRQLKKGSVGGAVIATAFLLGAKGLGGFWSPFNTDKEREGRGETKSNYAMGINKHFQHTAPFMLLQTAATFGHLYHKFHDIKNEGEILSVAKALAGTGVAVLGQVPMFKELGLIPAALTGNKEAANKLGWEIKGMAKPALYNEIFPAPKGRPSLQSKLPSSKKRVAD